MCAVEPYVQLVLEHNLTVNENSLRHLSRVRGCHGIAGVNQQVATKSIILFHQLKLRIIFTKRNYNYNSIIAKVIPKTISADKSHLAARRRGSREFKYKKHYSLEVHLYYTSCTTTRFGYFFKVLISPKPQCQ